MRLLVPASLAGITLGVLLAHPLPPQMKADGATRAIAAPVHAIEDFFDARDGIGAPCADAVKEARPLGERVTADLPRCWTAAPDAATRTLRLADPRLQHYDVAVSQVGADASAWPSFLSTLRHARDTVRDDAEWEVRRTERDLPDGRRAFAWLARDAGGGITFSLAADRDELFSPKLQEHLARVEAAALSLRRTSDLVERRDR